MKQRKDRHTAKVMPLNWLFVTVKYPKIHTRDVYIEIEWSRYRLKTVLHSNNLYLCLHTCCVNGSGMWCSCAAGVLAAVVPKSRALAYGWRLGGTRPRCTAENIHFLFLIYCMLLCTGTILWKIVTLGFSNSSRTKERKFYGIVCDNTSPPPISVRLVCSVHFFPDTVFFHCWFNPSEPMYAFALFRSHLRQLCKPQTTWMTCKHGRYLEHLLLILLSTPSICTSGGSCIGFHQ